MRNLLRILGGIWAIIGVANIATSSSFTHPKVNDSFGPVIVLLFNIILFIGPGLVLAGIGSIIKKKNLDEKKCPHCAEMIKFEARKCRYCNTEL